MKFLVYIFISFFLTFSFSYSTFAEGVKKYYITCDPADLQAIYDNPLEDIYIPITMEYDGKVWTDTEIRIRGDGSRLDPKKSFKVKFKGEPFSNGREKLNFNGEYLDLSYMSSYLSAYVFRKAGIPVFDIEHAALYINNEFWGLYLRIENVDEQYLEARGMDVKGNLYKATNSGASLAIDDECSYFWEEKTNEDGNFDDLYALRDSVNSIPITDFKNFVSRHFDYDRLIDVVAINILLSNASTYYHNYYLYHDINGTGKWMYMPWDMDKTFSNQGYTKEYSYTSHPIRTDNPLIEKCFINDEVFEEVKSRVQHISKTIMNHDTLYPVLDSLKHVIKEYVLMDESDHVESLEDWEKALTNFETYLKERIKLVNRMFEIEPQPFEVFRGPADIYDEYTYKWEPSTSKEGDVQYKIYLNTNRNIIDGNAVIIDSIKNNQYTFKDLENGQTYYFMVVAEAEGKERIGFDDHNVFTYHKTNKIPCEIAKDMTIEKKDSPYRVDCDLTINKGITLTIEDGVDIVVGDLNVINVKGQIKREANKDGVSIVASNEESHFELNFYNSDPIDLEYFNFKNAKIYIKDALVDFNSCNFEINENFHKSQIVNADSLAEVNYNNCSFYGKDSGEGIIYKNSHGDLVNCYFDGVKDAIEYHYEAYGSVIACEIQNSKDDGIDLNGAKQVHISNCRISGIADKAISLGHVGDIPSRDVSIDHVVIENAETGVGIKDKCKAEISNLDIVNCKSAVSTYNSLGKFSTELSIENTIFYKNQQDIENSNNSSIEVSYSLSDLIQLEGKGNIKADPMFVDELNSNYRLKAGSPAIDAGNPDTDNDPDGTRADIGALSFDQSSAAVIINEIHYNQDDLVVSGDWIEIFNNSDGDINIGNWTFMDSDDAHRFIIPDGTILKSKGYLVLVESELDFTSSYPDIPNYIGETGFGLSGGGELIRLYNANLVLIDMVEYDDKSPWPTEPDGDGYTLSLIDPGYDNALPESWKASEEKYGTPGKANFGTGISEIPNISTFKIYPIPATDNITIDYSSKLNMSSVYVYDTFGNAIIPLIQENVKGKLRLDIRNLYSGSYYFIFRLEDGSSLSSKFLIAK